MTSVADATTVPTGGSVPLLSVRDLSVTFAKRGLLAAHRDVHAVRGISFDLAAGRALGIVGESGSGKSTMARGVMRLVPASGSVRFRGDDLLLLDRRRLRVARRGIQMVFQDPYSSIDPSSTVADIVGEPLRVHEKLRRKERDDRVADLLGQVGLSGQHLHRYPHEFSGGQRQRVAIARAIATNPALTICDEAVSALDVSTQNQVLNLLEDLQASHGLAYLFITHNLAVVQHIADEIGVMYLGRIVEIGPAASLFEAPSHPYTRALLAAMPVARAGGRERDGVVVRGELPDPADPPAGCAFHPRCPEAMPECREQDPALRPRPGSGSVACHLVPEVPVSITQHAVVP